MEYRYRCNVCIFTIDVSNKKVNSEQRRSSKGKDRQDLRTDRQDEKTDTDDTLSDRHYFSRKSGLHHGPLIGVLEMHIH